MYVELFMQTKIMIVGHEFGVVRSYRTCFSNRAQQGQVYQATSSHEFGVARLYRTCFSKSTKRANMSSHEFGVVRPYLT